MGIGRFYTAGHKIRRKTVVIDDFGGETETWADHLTIDGKVWPLTGSEGLSADRNTYFAVYKLATSPADILETDRYCSPDGVEYYIKAILPMMRPDGTGHIELLLELIK